MGITFLDIRVSNPQKPRNTRAFHFLVDSGAIYTVVPEGDLKALGIAATSTREFILANGERIECRVGNAIFEYKGKIGAAPVIFGKRASIFLGLRHSNHWE
jgi:predicted aspartyl protease